MKMAIAAATLSVAFGLAPTRRVEAGDDPASKDDRVSCKGTVLDQHKKPIVGAKVFLRNDWACPTNVWEMPETDVVAETVTNESGKFQFAEIDVESVKRHGSLMLSVVVRADGFA